MTVSRMDWLVKTALCEYKKLLGASSYVPLIEANAYERNLLFSLGRSRFNLVRSKFV